MKKMLPVVLALLCACEPVAPPLQGPHILSISPTTQSSAQPQTVTVQLDTEPRFLVDYGRKSAQMIDQPTLQIGPQTVPLDTYLGHGQLQGTVASGLEVGRYDIRVSLGDGREATLPNAYEVKAGVADFWLESIGPQVQDQPFTITIHTAGSGSEHFEGTVMVSIFNNNDGATLFSMQSGAFSAGMRQEQLTIDTPGDNYLVIISDGHGNRATSNAFRVDPKI